MPTPMVAAARPALRSADPGCWATDTIIRFIASGNRAYSAPSITRTSANAISNSSGGNGSVAPYFAPPFKLPKKRKNSLSGDNTMVVSSSAKALR